MNSISLTCSSKFAERSRKLQITSKIKFFLFLSFLNLVGNIQSSEIDQEYEDVVHDDYGVLALGDDYEQETFDKSCEFINKVISFLKDDLIINKNGQVKILNNEQVKYIKDIVKLENLSSKSHVVLILKEAVKKLDELILHLDESENVAKLRIQIFTFTVSLIGLFDKYKVAPNLAVKVKQIKEEFGNVILASALKGDKDSLSLLKDNPVPMMKAQKNILENYFKRLKRLEEINKS